MSILVQALAMLPAVAAIVVVLTALADRREGTSLNSLRMLDIGPSAEVDVDADLERSAA